MSSSAQTKPTTPTTYLLTGDIGGTNSRMSLYDVCSNTNCQQDQPLVVKYFLNDEDLPNHVRNEQNAFRQHILIPFLKHCWEETTTTTTSSLVDLKNCQIIACLATAGFVMNNRVNMTNLDGLLVDGNAIAADNSNEYLQRVMVCRIINDFVGQGYGCLTLQPHEVKLLHGPSQHASLKNLPVGPKVCVGAGTGLGECYLTPNNDIVLDHVDGNNDDDDNNVVKYSCFPSEGGHVEYAPRNALEIKMWQYLSDRYASKKRISVERVVSGIGLATVYEFLTQEYPDQIEKAVHEEFLQARRDKKAPMVADNAKPGTLCLQAMDIVMSAYGCEVGSAAIKWIPLGGLFVTGGVTHNNIHHMQDADSEFMKSYLDKGRVSHVLEKIPLFAVLVDDLGVRGAHKAALMEYERFVASEQHDCFEETSL